MKGHNSEGKVDAKGELYLTEEFWKRLGEVFAVQPEPLGWYDVREYDLSIARNDFRIADFDDVGDVIWVLELTAGATASIKFNNAAADSFSLATWEMLRYSYTEVYISNAAQPGSVLRILYARGKWDLRRRYGETTIEDAETVDGLHASNVATADTLLSLGPDAMFPDGVVRNIRSGVIADLPAVPTEGDVYISTDTNEVYICSTVGAWTDITDATSISIVDVGGYYAGANVEVALQELGPYMADVDGFPDRLKFLATAEIQQLENIGVTAISAAQWEALGAYEEGAWTPEITFGGASVNMTYTTQAGLYTKIGRLVTVTCRILLSNKGTSVGTALIEGLPFTCKNADGAYSTVVLKLTNITFANQFQGGLNKGVDTITLQEITEAGNLTVLDNTDFANDSNIILMATYFTD